MKAKHLFIIIITTLIQYNVFSQSNFPNDEFFQYQWYLQTIHVPQAWSITKGAPEVTIAIIDGGVHWTNEDLGPEYDNHSVFWNNPGEDPWIPWNNPDGGDKQDGNDPYAYIDDYHGMDFYQKASGNTFVADNSPIPNYTEHPYYHGTSLAGIIAAKTNNNLYLSGIGGGDIAIGIEGLKILPIKIGDKDPQAQSSVQLSFNADSLAKAIRYAVNMGAKVINISLGFDPNPHYSNAIQDAINYANSHNVTVVVSAGNSNTLMNTLPAICDGVIRVGASTMEDRRWYASNYGSGNRPLDLVAPGEQIPVLTSDEVIIYPEPTQGNSLSGTSYAAAMVSATIGLMLSVNPGLTPEQIRQILHESSDKVNPQEYPYINGYNDYMGYGRLNTYQAVCMAISQIGTNTITTNQVWNTARYSGDIIVKQGNTLTIRTTVYMNPGSKIIIEPGAQLILENAYLTNCHVCGNDGQMWKGIEVWGTKSLSQLVNNGICFQGKLYVRNQSKIEHAEIGILVGARINDGTYDINKAGGIIRVENDGSKNTYGGLFINNQYGIRFLPYHNKVNGIERDNLSSISDAYFEVNNNYLGDAWFYSHIYLFDVKGIKITGCKFEQNKSEEPSGHGINAYQAGFKVEPLCISQIVPCEEQYLIRTSFKNFAKGINLVQGGTYTLWVNDAEFWGNSRGVSLENVCFAGIVNSDFKIGKASSYDIQNCPEGEASGYGIYMYATEGFVVEENSFTKISTAPPGNYTGVYIGESKSVNQVYKNYFNGLTYGNYAEGVNHNGILEAGLAYYCNENNNNWRDFQIEKRNNFASLLSGIQDPQGSTYLPAGNTFSPMADTHIYNNGNYWIGYYYNAPTPGNNNTPYYPARVYRVTREPVVGIQNPCISHYQGGIITDMTMTPDAKEQASAIFSSALDNYNNIKILFEALKDGGNTLNTITEIEQTLPEDMWNLRADLLTKSPHLSIEVLKTLADKTGILPDQVIFEILLANPDELKKDELIRYLEGVENPLPGYMIEILKQVSEGATYKTVLLEHMAHYKQIAMRAANAIIRSLLNDSIENKAELRYWLSKVGGITSEEQLIASYLSNGEFTNAWQEAANLPYVYDFSETELLEHNYFMEMLNFEINLMQDARTIFVLDSSEVEWLNYIAKNSMGTAGSKARSILEFVYGYHFTACMHTQFTGLKKSKEYYQKRPSNKNDGKPVVDVWPNPAGEWTCFNYTLPKLGGEGILRIKDAGGRVIGSFKVRAPQGQYIWDTRGISRGIYFYTLEYDGHSLSGRIIIQK